MREIEKFERDELEDELFGYVIDESDELLLIAGECDLDLDGFRVFRKSSISLRETDEATRFSSDILEKEGLSQKIDFDIKLNLASISECIQGLQGQWILLEDGENVMIGLGELVKVGSTALSLKPFDGAGGFDEEELISLDEVFTISFGTRYLRLNKAYTNHKN